MSLFHKKSVEEKQLDAILNELQINMANNYKDNACTCFSEFAEDFLKMKEEGVLKPEAVLRYEKIYSEYSEKLEGYSHNAQKPYWTKEDLG